MKRIISFEADFNPAVLKPEGLENLMVHLVQVGLSHHPDLALNGVKLSPIEIKKTTTDCHEAWCQSCQCIHEVRTLQPVTFLPIAGAEIPAGRCPACSQACYLIRTDRPPVAADVQGHLHRFQYGVFCRADPSCGLQQLDHEAYMHQMMRADSGWRCPRCGGEAMWDDDSLETNPPDEPDESGDPEDRFGPMTDLGIPCGEFP